MNNIKGGINSCDVPYTDDLKGFLHELSRPEFQNLACHEIIFFLNIRRLLIVKLMIPEKHMAIRLQMTTSQPVNLSISSSTPNLNKNTAEVERLYPPNSLKNLRTEASGRFRVLSFHT